MRSSVPRSTARRHAAAHATLALIAIGAASGWVPRAAAADIAPSDSRNQLDRPIADLALLAPGGPDDVARLLVVDAVPPGPGLVRLAILQRDRIWGIANELALDLDTPGSDAVASPWLIGLGPGRFALFSSGAGSTAVHLIATDGGPGGAALEAGPSVVLPFTVTEAGPADVDADGDTELVVGTSSPAGAYVCQPATVQVLDGADLRTRLVIERGDRDRGGVIGAFDAVPGDDLIGYATEGCQFDFGLAPPARLVGVRLLDGTTFADRPDAAPGGATLGAPLRVDLGTDGHPALLAHDAGRLALLDPAAGWSATDIADGSAHAVLAADGAGQDGASRIGIVEMPDDGGGGAISIVDVGAVAGQDAAVTPVASLPSDDLDGERWKLILDVVKGAALARSSPAIWTEGIADPDCVDLLLPGAIMTCGSDQLRPGAIWVATRPVTTLGEGPRRRLLVAGGMGWEPAAGLPATPAPWATAPAGWWRHGPSAPFALSELRAGDATYFQDFPIPHSTLEKTAGPDRTTNVPGFTGVRLFTRARGLADGAPDPDPGRPLESVLGDEPEPAEQLVVARVPVGPGLEAGRDGGFTTVELPPSPSGDASTADRWSMSVVAVNDWGEIGVPTTAVVARDHVGPFLNLDVPFMSPVWPIPASLSGNAEPGTTVVVDGVGPVELDRRGRFRVPTTLAPWPQTIRLTATDASDNRTVQQVTVIGGVDYRRFPWPTIVAMLLLLVVAASGFVGTRWKRGVERERVPAAGAAGGVAVASAGAGRWGRGFGLEDPPAPEIEELPPGSGLPRV